MKINEDYRVKLKMLNVLKDSYAEMITSSDGKTKIPCFNIKTGAQYEVILGQYLLSLNYSIRLMEREVFNLKQKSVWMKTIKSLFPW